MVFLTGVERDASRNCFTVSLAGAVRLLGSNSKSPAGRSSLLSRMAARNLSILRRQQSEISDFGRSSLLFRMLLLVWAAGATVVIALWAFRRGAFV